MLKNSEKHYGLLSRALHGIMLLLILVMLGVGIYMTGLDKTDELRKQLFSLHISTGVLVLLLTIVRLSWFKISPAPELPIRLNDWEKLLTKLVKSMMYLLMLIIPIVGILIVNTKGLPVSFYGLFDLFMLTDTNEKLHEFMEESHEFFAFSLLLLIVVHVLAALKHRFIDMGDDLDVMGRMFGKND